MRPRGIRLSLVLVFLASGCTDEELAELGFEHYIVGLEAEPSEVAAEVQELADSIGFEPLHVYDKATQGFSVLLHEEWAADLRGLDEVKYVRKDEKVKRGPGDPEDDVPEEDEILPDPEPVLGPDEIPLSIVRIGGPYLGPVDLSTTHVAVIDTGVDGDHPDLNVVANFDAVAAGGGAADDGDPNGHGTHVAGTIGAVADGEGVVGVAPGVPIHAVRVLDAAGSGWITDIVAGLDYVLDHPEIQVVNMSLGGPSWDGEDPMLDAIQALEDAGVLVVVAAGNEAQDTANVSPGGYPLGITVSAYDADGGDNGFAWFSNYGDEVDIAAPGTSILSTWPGGDYAELDGTSMATPAVAGAAAVYRAINPGAGVNKVRNAVQNTGEAGYAGQGGDHPENLISVEDFWADAE